ncbi:MAG TPA: DUF6691 family protein [Stellaceae bacterium]|nr:DUF6691 family protein [Stellaceae bacterium]
MARILVALGAGLLFGLGLTVSQMINPAKVLGFLDLFGDWDPSLAFVMLGAIPVAAIGYRVARSLAAPWCGPAFAAPAQSKIDGRLVSGAVLFGVGWGMVGYCPGPALASIALGNWATVLFLVAMLIGMTGFTGFQFFTARRLRQA